MKKTNTFRLAATALSLVLLPAASQADVRVLHLSPDAPEVDVLLGPAGEAQETVLSDVPYPTVSPYLPVPTGSYDIDVVPSAGGDSVIDVNGIAIDGDTLYSIAAINTLDMIEPLVLEDDNTLLGGKARLRVVHASPNAGPVDVSVDGLGVVLPGFDFMDASNYFELDPGSYNVRLFEPGTTSEIFAVEGLDLDGSTVYSAFAIGLVGDQDSPFTVLPTVDAVPEPAGMALAGLGGALILLGYHRRRAA